jgi:hypothetical protein
MAILLESSDWNVLLELSGSGRNSSINVLHGIPSQSRKLRDSVGIRVRRKTDM